MWKQEEFEYVAKDSITRDGIDALLAWLNETGFYHQPASTRYHLCVEGGLCHHSVNVYHYLLALVGMKYGPDSPYTLETLAIVSLFHDVCKDIYKQELRWRKDANNRWEQYPIFTIDDPFPYGHGEKSVYYISKFMKLTDEEAMAIRWHMGFSDIAYKGGSYDVGNAINKYPLVALLHCADLLASASEE